MTLNEEGSATCTGCHSNQVQPDIQYLSSLVQKKNSHLYYNIRNCFPLFNVAWYKDTYQSGSSIVFYIALLINIVIFKLFILNQYVLITGFSDTLPAIFALI